jgi:hypothetical protein
MARSALATMQDRLGCAGAQGFSFEMRLQLRLR